MDQKKIGAFLKGLRKENGLTQEQLSEKLGVNSRTVSRWENANTMPDFDLMITLAKPGPTLEIIVSDALSEDCIFTPSSDTTSAARIRVRM